MNKLGAGMAGVRCSTSLCVCDVHILIYKFCVGPAGPRTTLGPAKGKRRPNKKPIKRGVHTAELCCLAKPRQPTLTAELAPVYGSALPACAGANPPHSVHKDHFERASDGSDSASQGEDCSGSEDEGADGYKKGAGQLPGLNAAVGRRTCVRAAKHRERVPHLCRRLSPRARGGEVQGRPLCGAAQARLGPLLYRLARQ